MKRFARLIPVAALFFTVACGRTDVGITADVKTKLAADDTVKAYQVDVDTRNHVVTLSGNVETTAAKEQAVLLARQTKGVSDVIDNLHVSETAATSGRAGELVNDAEAKAKDGADAVADAAREAGKGVKKGAEEIGHGAKKIGTGIRDAVTDKDHDSDKDGK